MPRVRLRPDRDASTRLAIKTKQIVNRLQGFVLGELELGSRLPGEERKPIEMSKSQVAAAIALLRKVLPDLSSVEVKEDGTARFVAEIPAVAKDMDEWARQHAPMAARRLDS